MANGGDGGAGQENKGIWRKLVDFVQGPQLWRTVGLAIVPILIGLVSFMIYKALPTNGFTDVEFTRGLITVILLVSVIGAMLLMTFAALFSSEDSSQQGVTLEKRIAASREIITPLVGILGTIIGFYFGSQQAKENHEAPQKPVPAITNGLAQAQSGPNGAANEVAKPVQVLQPLRQTR